MTLLHQSNGVWHKDGALAQIKLMAEWADAEAVTTYPNRETLGKIAANIRDAVKAIERGRP